MRIVLSAALVIVIELVTTGVSRAAIVSIGTGMTPIGDRNSNLVANGSFESRFPLDSLVPTPAYWSGISGFHTENTLVAPFYAIPGWSQTSGRGAYGMWGQSSAIGGDPCVDGLACVYFGNWATVPSQSPIFKSDGTVTFASPPAFTNIDFDNQTPTTLFHVLNGLIKDETYILDFWTTGEHYYDPLPDPGVFQLSIGGDSVFLTVPSMNSVFNANSIRYHVIFIADSISQTISFTNWGHITSSADVRTAATELILDDVIVNQVSEPISGALVAGGLIGIYAIRRRKP
jgi:hypothetical protein